MKTLKPRLALVFCLLPTLCAIAAAGPQESEKNRPRIRAEVNQVVVYATVYDAQGVPLSGLKKDDFEIYEDRVLQTVDYFGVGGIPSTIGLVLDISGSMKSKMGNVEEAAKLFLDTTESEANELFLMSFNREAVLEEPFTRDAVDIQEGIENLIPSGGTALFDAVYLAVDQADKGSEPRKAVIVFTDGEDKDSYYELAELIEKVQEADVQVYLVAFLDEDLSDDGGFFGVFKSQREKVQQEINQIAEASGGKAFFPAKREDLGDSFKSIARELQNQYYLGYVSTNPLQDGSWRTVRVVLKNDAEKGRRVRAKKGYFARKADIAKRD